VLGFAQQEDKRRDGNTWWVLVAGEETDEGLSTWRRTAAAAAHQSSESERGARETDRNARMEGGMRRAAGRLSLGLFGGAGRAHPHGKREEKSVRAGQEERFGRLGRLSFWATWFLGWNGTKGGCISGLKPL
jgi:hypothetical protein